MGSAGQLARPLRQYRQAQHRSEQQALPDGLAWLVAVVAIVSRSALTAMVALLLWSVLPNLFGFHTTAVMSGSMMPRLMVGDAVVVRSVGAAGLARGQVLLMDDPDRPSALRLHRLVEVGADGRLVTKGDANAQADSSTVGFAAVQGAGFLRVPFAGLPTYWARTGQLLPLVGGGAVVLLLMAGVRLGRLLEGEPERARRRRRHARLRGAHRAVAAAAALLVLSAGATPPPASAGFSASTAPPASSWGTTCGDVPWSTGATPSLDYGFGTRTSTTVGDLSPSGDTGTLRGGVSVSSCTNGYSPFASFSGTNGLITGSVQRSHPTALTIATWFRVNPGDAGGVLAVFGSSSGAAASAGVDDGLYMGDSGTLTFGAASVQALGLVQTAYRYCSTAAGYADGSWHLVVATLSGSGCTITVDANPATTVSTPFVLSAAVGAFSGYWRFGYDDISTAVNAPSRMYFKGALDEIQIFGSALPFAAQTAIYAAGHGGPPTG